MGRWEPIRVQVWETVVTPCDCCGQVVAKQLWVAEVEGDQHRFCSPACEDLYRRYVAPKRHDRGQTPEMAGADMTRGQTPGRARKGQEVEWRAGVRTVLHVAASGGASQLCVMEQWSEPGAGAPTHTHFEVEEAILVVSGEADFWSDGEHRGLGAGEAILLPARSQHGFRNTGDGVLHTVAVFGAAAPPVEYEDEPGVVYEIGGTGEARRDAHRAVRGAHEEP